MEKRKYIGNNYDNQFNNWFSRAIRLSGYKPESTLDVRTITFIVTEDCNLRCTYCVPAGTKVATPDFGEKNIEDLVVGSKVLGFNEYSEGKGKHRKVYSTTVTQLFHRKDSILRIELENGYVLKITKEHPILNTRGSSKYSWKEAGKYKVGDSIRILPLVSYPNTNTEDINYKSGYVVAMMLGDGSYKHYDLKNGGNTYKIRLAVKDAEIIDRVERYSKDIGLKFYRKPYLVSKVHNLMADALFANTLEMYNKICELIACNVGINTTQEYLCGFLAGIYDAEGSISNNSIRIVNTDINIINEIERALDVIEIPYIKEFAGRTINDKQKYMIRIISPENTLNTLKFIKTVLPAVSRKGTESLHGMALMTNSKIKNIVECPIEDVYNIETTSSTYFANGVAVHNCYLHGKNNSHIMSKETGRKAIDFILSDEKMNGYIVAEASPCVILDFIGGEPLLNIDVIDDMVEYFKFKTWEMDHPWKINYMISMASNGILYESKKVQDFIKKNPGRISIGITIDGTKELHDTCRVYPDGRGSYDDVERNVKLWVSQIETPTTKVTLAPSNIKYLRESVKHLWSLGVMSVPANPVFEDVWHDPEIITFYYHQLVGLADDILDNDWYNTYHTSLFDENMGMPLSETDNTNFCGGDGMMMAIGPEGNVYPCLRYAKYSMSCKEREPIIIGHIDTIVDIECQGLCDLKCITRRSQSTDECFNCPIAKGCSWCSAFNYDLYGTANKRTTTTCEMFKARTLANVYYWNKLYKKLDIDKSYPMNVPEDWALKIIDKEEYDMLCSLVK